MSYDKNLWNSIKNELRNDKTRQEEMKSKSISCRNNKSLRFYDKVVGNPGPSGYCLFVCLHGGGQCAASKNDSQWKEIIPFEQNGFKQGTIAVAARGITDTWNLHFVDESFPAITRLIEDYIIFKDVDPNKVYLMGFSAGGDGTYSLSERIPYLLAACSPQAGHPNGISTINLCNLPIYLAAGEKDTSFKRHQICVDYYKQILAQNGKYYGNYIAKVEVVAGSGHSFQCWRTPRNSFFNGNSKATTSNDTAFTFMYSYTRNPNPKEISCDVKTFLTPLRNYYTPRGNSFYNLEIGKTTSDMIQVQINYDNNSINVKEGNNFRINLVSSLFKKGNTVNVTHGGKTQSYQLQKDNKYAKSNIKLYCDPYLGYDSFINIGDFSQEVKLEYVPKSAASANSAPPKVVAAPKNQVAAKAKVAEHPPKVAKPAKKAPKIAAVKSAAKQIPKVNKPTPIKCNNGQYINCSKNGESYYCFKLAETEFAWTGDSQYWVKKNDKMSLLGTQIYHLNKVFYLNPSFKFIDIPKSNYFVLLRHNPCHNSALNTCTLTIKINGKAIYSKQSFKKDYSKVKNNKVLFDDFITNISADDFINQDKNEVLIEIFGDKVCKKNWDLDGVILIPDNCDGKIETIYNQYFSNELYKI